MKAGTSGNVGIHRLDRKIDSFCEDQNDFRDNDCRSKPTATVAATARASGSFRSPLTAYLWKLLGTSGRIWEPWISSESFWESNDWNCSVIFTVGLHEPFNREQTRLCKLHCLRSNFHANFPLRITLRITLHLS